MIEQIIIKDTGNKDKHKNSYQIDLGPDQTIHLQSLLPLITLDEKMLVAFYPILCNLHVTKRCTLSWTYLNFGHKEPLT